MMRATALLALWALLLVPGSEAGDRHFRAGRYADAAAEYRRALARGEASPALHYNLGTALLRQGRHEEAREHFVHATREGEPRVRQHAYYNLGNSYLEPAFAAPPSAERTDALRRAIVAYRGALLLDPDDFDAKWNLELAERLIARQAGGGGGGADEPAGGGGADAERDARARPDPSPAPAAGPGGEAGMSREEAERVLRAASEREQALQQEKLRRAERPPPNVRDW